MIQISDIMQKADSNLLLQIYREPSITAYNRLEPRPRSEDFERSLRAEIRDPLWYLTRQWQMGELESEDCGSAIDARIVTKHIHVDRISLKPQTGISYHEEIPMETLVERESVSFTLALKIQTGQYFLKLHTPALKSAYLNKYLSVFFIDQNKEDQYKGQTDGLSLYISTQKRAIDGEKIYKAIKNGTFKTAISLNPGDDLAFTQILDKFLSWFQRQYSQPDAVAGSAWNPQQLDYNFSVAAPSTVNGGQIVLRANHYHSGKLDWYNFDMETDKVTIPTDNVNNQPLIEENDPISFIPTGTQYKGMPNARFWEMEERQLNFGKLNAKTTDHLLLTFAEFGLVYGNDWFVIPYKMPVNTLCEIKGLVITDVFGERTLIKAADEGEDNQWQRWSMFNISNKNHMGAYNRQFFLPSTLVNTMESEPIEEVNFIRDEMANLVWGIEDIIPDATGKGISGHEAADKTPLQPPPIPGSQAPVRYILGTTVPENWIPFIPVHKPGNNQEINFQRASMPKLGFPPKDVIKAKGVLLTEVPPPYFINEEEIPYSGTIVTRSYQRVRWYNGKTFIWLGRYKETGRGQGSSNLRFDQIEAKPSES